MRIDEVTGAAALGDAVDIVKVIARVMGKIPAIIGENVYIADKINTMISVP